MGHLHAVEFREILGRDAGLEAHLVGNFYPPIPGKVRQTIQDQFRLYWSRPCKSDLLLQRINKALKSAATGWRLATLERFEEFLQ